VEGKLPRYAATLGEVEEVERERHEYYDRIQSEAKAIAQQHEVDLDLIVAPGSPAEVIVRSARDGNYDLIVLGHKGHSRLHEYLVGATTDRVAHLAPCAVLIVP
jgi:nucleotide-binding universal stress UspA family protein